MNKKIINILGTTVGQLVFALLSGAAYFMVILRFIAEWSGGSMLIAFFFAPAVICGAALVIIKLMKQARENENYSVIPKIFWLHAVLLAVGIVFVLSMFM